MLPHEFIGYLRNYEDKLDASLIKKACDVALTEHEGQFRKSGAPYITHTLSVAYNLLNYNFDTHTICAAILHDIIEDTGYSQERLKEEFGENILNLVLGVTKLSRINFTTDQESKVENLRKFILSFIGDIRVLIIKLFDRLDNIRTIHYIEREEKRRRIAQETLDIYVPLAERISLHEIKDELEDLSFAVVNPQMRDSIVKKIEEVKGNYSETFQEIEKEINLLLKEYNINIVNFKGRIKKPYSIWKKIVRKGSNFEDIFDILAFRIITNDVKTCYDVMYALHSKYKAIFDRFKDFISSPKSNNYKSLHTGIYFKDKVKLEIQIRTKEMDIFAENGIAAHWNYKNPANTSYDIAQYSWLRNLISILSDLDADAEDIYEYSKLEIFTNQIFVFTPRGEVIDLPKNSCALDFAYAIHSDIGNKCVSVTIDGEKQSIFTRLQNGQRIEIHTDKNQEPQAIWLSFVKTGIAKLNIKKHLRQKRNSTIISQAHSILNYIFEKEGITFYPEIVAKIMNILNIKSSNIFYEKMIEGKINLYGVFEKLYPHLKINKDNNYKNVIDKEKISLAVKNWHFSDCCYSVYGDSIIGIYLPEGLLEIHHSNCEMLYSKWVSGLTMVRLYWSEKADIYEYRAKLCLELTNTINSLVSITTLFADNNIFIETLNTEKIYNSESTNIHIICLVKDIEEIEFIVKKLKESKLLKNIERYIN